MTAILVDDQLRAWDPFGQLRRIARLAQRILRAAPPWYSPRKVVVPDTVDAVLAKYDAAAA